MMYVEYLWIRIWIAFAVGLSYFAVWHFEV